MKARIRTKEQRIAENIREQFYNRKTGKIKNEEQFFNNLYDELAIINRQRQEDKFEKFVMFEEQEDGTYLFYDEIFPENIAKIKNAEGLILLLSQMILANLIVNTI